MSKFPKSVYLYQCDTVEGAPVYCVANSVNEIPEDESGSKIGHYSLNGTHVFVVDKKLDEGES